MRKRVLLLFPDNETANPGRRGLHEAILLYATILTCFLTGPIDAQEPTRAWTLPDLSGLARVEDDPFEKVNLVEHKPDLANPTAARLVELKSSHLSRTQRDPMLVWPLLKFGKGANHALRRSQAIRCYFLIMSREHLKSV